MRRALAFPRYQTVALLLLGVAACPPGIVDGSTFGTILANFPKGSRAEVHVDFSRSPSENTFVEAVCS